MERKSQYKTRQRETLESYLRARPGQHTTAAELCARFSMGKATVYRQLERLVEEGMVAKYTVDGTTAACFAYVGPVQASERPVSYHCKCQQCGLLIHLHCDEVEHLRLHMLDHHGFALDACRTVFYGLCETCRAAQG